MLPQLIPLLQEQGYAYLPQKSLDELPALLAELGTVIQETEVRANTQSKSLVTSDRLLDFHTDNHLAKYIVWYCHRAAEEGGESMLCDAQAIYTQPLKRNSRS